MRVAALIGVKDEAALIEPLIRHLRKQRITEFAVIDVSSTDGTREILARHADENFTVHDIASSDDEAAWQELTGRIIAGIKSEWLFLIDADEFPLTPSGDIRIALRTAHAHVLRLPRYNVVLAEEGLRMALPCKAEDLGKVDLIVKGVENVRVQLALDPALSWIRTVPKHKLAIRPKMVETVGNGMHDVIARGGRKLKVRTATNILLAHTVLTTYERFARKIDNIRELFRLHEHDLPPEFGWHWRRWLDLADQGLLKQEFANSRLSEAQIANLRGDGFVRTAAEMLADAVLADEVREP